MPGVPSSDSAPDDCHREVMSPSEKHLDLSIPQEAFCKPTIKKKKKIQLAGEQHRAFFILSVVKPVVGSEGTASWALPRMIDQGFAKLPFYIGFSSSKSSGSSHLRPAAWEVRISPCFIGGGSAGVSDRLWPPRESQAEGDLGGPTPPVAPPLLSSLSLGSPRRVMT